MQIKLQVIVSKDERDLIKDEAKAKSLSVSSYLRSLALQDINKNKQEEKQNEH